MLYCPHYLKKWTVPSINSPDLLKTNSIAFLSVVIGKEDIVGIELFSFEIVKNSITLIVIPFSNAFNFCYLIMDSFIVLDRNTDLNDEEIDATYIKIDNNEYLFSIVDIPYSMDADLDDDCVLVKIKAFSCNYRDKAWIKLFYERCENVSTSDSFPFSYFGSDFVGEVVRIGKKVQAFAVGDRVIPDDSYPRKSDNVYGGVVTNVASKRIQVFRESCLAKVPESMSDSEAAGFPLTALTSNSIISKANIKAKERVLVTSLFSNTTIGCLEFLRHCPDVEVYALSTHAGDSAALMAHFNIRHVFLPSDFSQDEGNSKMVFDVIIDPFADIHLEDLSYHLNYDARYISCGLTNLTSIDIDLQKVLVNFIATNSVFIGNCLGRPGALKAALAAYNRGKYEVYIDSVFSGNQMSSFIKKTFNERHFGKVVYVYE